MAVEGLVSLTKCKILIPDLFKSITYQKISPNIVQKKCYGSQMRRVMFKGKVVGPPVSPTSHSFRKECNWMKFETK